MDDFSKHNSLGIGAVVIKHGSFGPGIHTFPFQAGQYYFADYTLEQLLPGYTDLPEVEFSSHIIIYPGQTEVIFDGSASHCYGSRFGEYPEFIGGFSFSSNNPENDNKITADGIQSGFSGDGSDCP